MDAGAYSPTHPIRTLSHAAHSPHPHSHPHVDWTQVLPQFPRFVGMLLVVAFSSSLDVAAIEMELGATLVITL